MSDASDHGKHAQICRKLEPAFSLLLEAFEFSVDANSDIWEFAVRLRHLLEIGCTENDFRWLVRKEYVKHRCEITVSGDNSRQFRSEGESVFCKRTCFVLTKEGVIKARALSNHQAISGPSGPSSPDVNGRGAPTFVPHWDEETNELRVDGKMVKRFKWPAVNQQLVLRAFQEEGWPARIDDPLPPQPDQDSKRRLSDTIKCLNGKQQNALIHFRGDGTGEGVIWELVNEKSSD